MLRSPEGAQAWQVQLGVRMPRAARAQEDPHVLYWLTLNPLASATQLSRLNLSQLCRKMLCGSGEP